MYNTLEYFNGQPSGRQSVMHYYVSIRMIDTTESTTNYGCRAQEFYSWLDITESYILQ
jgi:hypothetical protein